MRKYFLCMAIVSAMISSISCGKGGGGGSSVSGPSVTTEPTVDPSVVISFVPSGSPSDNTVYLEEVSKSNKEITLALKIKGGNNVFGVAAEITYDSNLIEYVSISEGTYLKQNGSETLFGRSLFNGQEGTLLIGCNRKGTVQGANGDGLLAAIVLKVKAKQTNTLVGFTTANCALELPAGSSPKYIAGTIWLGGNLSYK